MPQASLPVVATFGMHFPSDFHVDGLWIQDSYQNNEGIFAKSATTLMTPTGIHDPCQCMVLAPPKLNQGSLHDNSSEINDRFN